MPTPFEITRDATGTTHATNGTRRAVVDADVIGADVFRRRGVRNVGTPQAEALEWLVVRVDGLSIYIDGDTVVVSRKDLNP